MAEVKRLFLQRGCVQGCFTAADEKLALSLFGRGIPLVQVERAILLGAARKYSAMSQKGQGSPISSLQYFANLFEETRQQISDHYWTYVAHKVKTFEQIWEAQKVQRLVQNGPNRNTSGSSESAEAAVKPS